MSAGMQEDSGAVDVDVAGETLLLLPERAAAWPAMRTMIVADWHLGKAAVFGSRGLAIPDGDTTRDFETLGRLIARHAPERLLVLGDLMHAPPRPGDDWPQQLAAWLAGFPGLEFSVVAGNHDRVPASALPAGLDARIRWYDDHLDEGPFRFAHEPEAADGRYVLAGHLHPTRRLVMGADRVRAPAFWFRDHWAVLPAYGGFTGGMNIKPERGDRVFVTGPDAVVEVTGA
ncbi:MAG: ligase-associated DNA damage response endonuclease PdeM [Pseudomonadota bacterium]